MSRRRAIVLATATVLLSLLVIVVGLVATLTQTERGRALIMRGVLPTLAATIPGRLHIGRVSGNLFTDLTIDSLDIREPNGGVFLSTGRIRLRYDPRDLLDRRIVIRHLEVEHPSITLIDYGKDDWNWRRALQRRGPKLPKRPGGLGQYIVIDTAALDEVALTIRLPWALPDSLRGAKRDSALTYNLTRLDGEIRRDGERLVRVWRFTRGTARFGRVRLADPDSAGMKFDVRKLDVVWVYPPFWFRNLRTTATRLGDSLWLDTTRFGLANSEGVGTAKIVWGSNLPVRYDIRLAGEKVAMADVAWIHPSLPQTGSGTTDFRMYNDPRNLNVMRYELRNMDARSMRSRLLGNMTFAVGGPVLEVTDVNLDLAPANTDLLRHFNREPFPYDWQGDVTGRVVARGGPVTRFVIDRADLAFADAHVPGAVSRASASGRANIFLPADALLDDVAVRIDQLDLRTPRFVNPLFPDITGIVRGTVRLDSLWYDARFSEANLEHVDGPGDPSRFTGSGRYTLLAEGVKFDVDLQAAPLSYTTLSRSYPSLPLRGNAVGSIRAAGMAESFTLATMLTGEGGELSFDGRVDALEPIFGARGAFQTRALDLQNLFGDSRYPRTSLSLAGELELSGADLPSLRGPLRATVDQFSRVADARLFGATVQLQFDSGRVRVDTATVESSALRLTARGGIGLVAGRQDSLELSVFVDSLGGLRPWLVPKEPAATTATSPFGAPVTQGDTLRGAVELRARLRGTIDTLDAVGLSLEGQVTARDLYFRGSSALQGTATVNLADLLRGGTGSLLLAFDSARVAGIDVASASARASIRNAVAERFSVAARTPSESRVRVAGGVAEQGSERTVTLDTLDIDVDSAATGAARRRRGFSLLAPAVFTTRPGSAPGTVIGALDSLVLVHTDTGRLALRGALADAGVVDARLDAERIPLFDVGRLLRNGQLRGGEANFAVVLDGTRERPRFDGALSLRNAVAGRVRIGEMSAIARYDTTRLGVTAALNVEERPALQATLSLPVDLALVPGRERKLDRPLSGRIMSNGANLRLLEAIFPDVTRAQGALTTDVTLAGSWSVPRFFGAVRMDSAALTLENLGIRLERASADIALAGDSLLVRRFRAVSGAPGDTLGISGRVVFADLRDPSFDLRLAANNFLAIDKPRTASLALTTTTPITLVGSRSFATVRGAVRVERGRVYINALTQRRGLDLADNFDIIDTAATSMDALLPNAPNALTQNLAVDNLRVSIGDDVWLRSPEANLKMGGALRVTRAIGRDTRPRFALADSLVVERGSYALNLGIARPSFEVERGLVRFFGDPDLEPALDITALHTVRELRPNSNRQNVRIRVAIGGTINRPSLTLSSADNPPLPESDMLSYLVTGEPAYALLDSRYADQGATLALRLAGSYLSSRLAGGRFDVVQVEPTALSPGEANNLRQSGLGILASTRVGVGGQIARNTFLTLSTGLCGLAPQSGNADPLSLFAQGLGVRVERRFEGGLSAALGLEPASSAQACGRSSLSRTFQQTPPQFGFDLFKRWSY